MSDHERARIIALSLLGESPPDEAEVRRTAEIAVQAVRSQNPDAEVDTDSLVREVGGQPQRRRRVCLNPDG